MMVATIRRFGETAEYDATVSERLCYFMRYESATSLHAPVAPYAASISSDCITVRLRFGLDRIAGPWTLTRDDVSAVRRTNKWPYPNGIEIVAGVRRQWGIFGMRGREAAFHELEDFGYPAE